MNATVVNAPGYLQHFKATVLLDGYPSNVNLAVVQFGDGDLAVVPSTCVVKGLDLVKRLEIDYDWQEESWGVRHAFGGPFVWYGPKGEAPLVLRRKAGL